MIQTAEGALNETHAILQRMRELAVQSSTDTNTADDRSKIQGEVDQLAKEITRISNDTEFNTQNLMAGGLDNTFHVGANEGQNVDLKINAMDAKSLGIDGFVTSGTINSSNVGISEVKIDRTAGTSMANGTTQSFTVGDTAAKTKWEGTPTGLTDMDIQTKGDRSKYNDYKFEVKQGATGATTSASINENSKTITLTVDSGHAAVVTKAEVDAAVTNAAITTLNDAITTVSEERSKLGAMQNRLEHIIKNLDNTSENLQAAESRIRDVDMAKEMMKQTKKKILIKENYLKWH